MIELLVIAAVIAAGCGVAYRIGRRQVLVMFRGYRETMGQQVAYLQDLAKRSADEQAAWMSEAQRARDALEDLRAAVAEDCGRICDVAGIRGNWDENLTIIRNRATALRNRANGNGETLTLLPPGSPDPRD